MKLVFVEFFMQHGPIHITGCRLLYQGFCIEVVDLTYTFGAVILSTNYFNPPCLVIVYHQSCLNITHL